MNFTSNPVVAIDDNDILQVYDSFINEDQSETRKNEEYSKQGNESRCNRLEKSRNDEVSLH